MIAYTYPVSNPEPAELPGVCPLVGASLTGCSSLRLATIDTYRASHFCCGAYTDCLTYRKHRQA